jgi:choline dehydrogenase-like flavoprotein
MLGGSSALNFMMLVYPTKGNIDAWAELGNPSWTFETLAPYFRKFATVNPPPAPAKELLGLNYIDEGKPPGDGPLQVSYSAGYNVANKAWFDVFAELGIEAKSDPRDGTTMGAWQQPASIDGSSRVRSFSGNAYLTPEVLKRSNLAILTETLVTKVLLDTSNGGEPVATGVEISTKDGQTRTISATTEVIMAAGALQTPQILELSGIGGRSHLEKLGIPVIVDNPNVGEHLHDHPIVVQNFEVADGVPSGDVLRDPAIVQQLLGLYQSSNGAGPFGESIISVAYTPLVDGSGKILAGTPAAEQLFDGTTLETPNSRAIRRLVNSPAEPTFQYLLFPSQVNVPESPTSMAEYIIPTLPENYISIMTVLNQPLSQGSVHASSADPRAAPVWEPNYNSNPLDLELLARGVQFVERLVDPKGAFGKVLKQGGKRVPELVADDLETAKEIVRQRQISVFHLSGSCSMRPREDGGVVDERLRVYGVKGLRVVDASIFPLEPVGNIQSVVYAVAERAADLIKEDRASKA